MDQEKSKKKNDLSTFKLLKPYSGMIFLLILFALLSNALNLWIPKIIGDGIDDYENVAFVFRSLIIQFLIIIIIVFILTYLQSIIQTYASERVARDLRARHSDRISEKSF